jgi:protein TonB
MKQPKRIGKGFALRYHAPMGAYRSPELYSPREIALAAGVSEAEVVAALDGSHRLLAHADAVQLGRILTRGRGRHAPVGHLGQASVGPPSAALFSLFLQTEPARRSTGVPLALSSTLHAGAIAIAVFFATFNLAPHAAALRIDDRPSDPMRLVFVATPGPGGGGGGGGLRQPTPPPKALREGKSTLSSPVPIRREPKPIEPVPAPPEPKPEPPLKAEPLPAVVAPIIAAPADVRNRVGVLENTTADTTSQGPGSGAGAGSGKGTGLGSGDGAGIGPGSGGGTGGGPYRPGSGIEPPRLLREVKADYTEDARQRGIIGDVVLEIVVRRDGSVGDVRILQGLAGGLNDRAVQAVRQWQFAPARRQGAPVDVVVEVAVQFKLR